MIIEGQVVLLYDEPVLTKYIDITLGMGWEDVNLIKKVIEGLIIHKIVVGRARDIEDIKKILLKNSEINDKYIIGLSDSIEIWE